MVCDVDVDVMWLGLLQWFGPWSSSSFYVPDPWSPSSFPTHGVPGRYMYRTCDMTWLGDTVIPLDARDDYLADGLNQTVMLQTSVTATPRPPRTTAATQTTLYQPHAANGIPYAHSIIFAQLHINAYQQVAARHITSRYTALHYTTLHDTPPPPPPHRVSTPAARAHRFRWC